MACARSNGRSVIRRECAGPIVIAVGAAGTADQIALCSLQVRVIRADPFFAGGDYYEQPHGPLNGLSIARGIGQFSYRTWTEFETRFGRERPRRPRGARTGSVRHRVLP